MMTDSTDLADGGEARVPGGRKRRLALVGVGLVALALGGIWGFRERIAGNLIDRQLAALGLPMRYRIESIGLGREVIGAVVVGDPAHPDLTVERVEIVLHYSAAGPAIAQITLTRPRFHGRLVDGRLHLGALDRVLYAPSGGAAPRLPDWNLALVDARGRIDSDFGALGVSADGQGRLSDGFAGTLGLVAPQLQIGGCSAGRTTLYGTVTTRAGQPRLDGPLRLAGLRCADTRMAAGRIDLALAGDAALSDWTINAGLALGRIDKGSQMALARLGGAAGLRGQTGQGDLSGRITLEGQGLGSPALRLASARFDGVVHARQGFSALDLRGDLDGRSLARGPATVAALARARSDVAGTPLAPLLDRALAALAREETGSRLAGSIGLHAQADGWRLTAPSLVVRGGRDGSALARMDRLSVSSGDGPIPRVTGNLATGGADLPSITGTMTAGGTGGARFWLALAPYVAPGAALAVPNLTLVQAGDGSLDFSGTVALSGPLGQGRVDGLVVPVDGALAADGRLALLRHCLNARFARVRTGSIDVARGGVELCPVGGAMVRSGPAGVTVAASTPGLALRGRSGDAPFALRTGAARMFWPGTSTLEAVDLTLGDGNRVRLVGATVAAKGGTAAGGFTGGDVTLAALPATIGAARGDWRYDSGRLTLSGGTFELADRSSPARFAPVAAREVVLSLADQTVSANLHLVTPRGGDDLARVMLVHDLASGKGHADVAIAGLTFRETKGKSVGLQPDDLSVLAKGLIANANGTIRGTARFDWDSAQHDGGVTGSGKFSSDDLDFAAAVGPVEGLSGTIEFTDLIHLITAPHQILKVASINPGIEVVNGEIDIDLQADQVVRLNRAQWPFEGGYLALEPTALHMAVAEPRRFTLLIDGLQAGRFLQHVNIANLSATGTFDGQLPLVFDAAGGRIVGGQLTSRAPGGNVSYVGALSYRDLSPMANYAFRMLRSVDYSAMTIGMEGDLAGELITRVSFGGIRQGQGAERNLITRQLARLPIRFDVNVRAQFYQLLGSLRSLYDPAMVRDPRDLGLIDAQGRPIHHHGAAPVAPSGPKPPAIQPQASGTMP